MTKLGDSENLIGIPVQNLTTLITENQFTHFGKKII